MNNITHNKTENARSPGRYHTVYHSVLLFLALLIILHNFLVPFLYYKMKTLRKSTNFLLVSLGCADFLTGFLFIPLLVTSAAFSRHGHNYLSLHFTANVVSDFITLVTVFSLLLVTSERYIALCHPYIHPKLVTAWSTRCAVVICWSFAVAIAITPLTWSYPILVGRKADVSDYYKHYSFTILIGCFFLPSAIMIFCLVSMFNVIVRFVKQDTTRGLNVKAGRRSQRKAVFVFLAMFINWFVCWSPLMTIRLVMDVKKTFSPSKELLEILVALRCCSSLFNPAIYVWCKTDFKLAFFNIFFKCFNRKRNNAFELQVVETEAAAKFSLLDQLQSSPSSPMPGKTTSSRSLRV